MKATLTFSLPDEREDFNIALEGIKYHCAAHSFANWLRSEIKYDQSYSEPERNLMEKVRKEFLNTFAGLDI